MTDWKSILNADPTDWLLEEDNPSVRYFTLVDLLGKPEKDPEALRTKAEIMQRGTVPKILAKQQEGGNWDQPEKFYAAKYTGTVWQVIILAELGADGTDRRIHQACEFLLENSQDRQSYGFSTWASSKAQGGRKSYVIPCLTGNLIYSLIRFGYLQDARVQKSIEWITRVQRFDDGTEPHPMDWPYNRFVACWGKHSVIWGSSKRSRLWPKSPRIKEASRSSTRSQREWTIS